MPVVFHDVYCAPLQGACLRFDDGMIVGLVGPDGSGKGSLLRLAAARLQPERGTIEVTPGAVLIETGRHTRTELAAAMAGDPRVLLLDHVPAILDGVSQLRCVQELARLRQQGALVLVSCHDLPLLERICDVVVALEGGRIIEQGDPGLVLDGYRKRMVEQSRATAVAGKVKPSTRHGDRRVEITALEMLGETGVPTTTVCSGENITVRMTLCFRESVQEPVVGILIRSRTGVSVYGTNTELERVNIGMRRAGERADVEVHFACDLCPQEYTLTVASHDQDGTHHDWLEDALFFSVIDTRYTAGLANLRAKMRVR